MSERWREDKHYVSALNNALYIVKPKSDEEWRQLKEGIAADIPDDFIEDIRVIVDATSEDSRARFALGRISQLAFTGLHAERALREIHDIIQENQGLIYWDEEAIQGF